MAFQNLADPATITLRSFSGSLTGTYPNIATIADITNNSTSQTWLVKSCVITNHDDQYNGDVEIRVGWGANGPFSADIVYKAWVPFGTNLTVINDSLPIYLDYNEKLYIHKLDGIKMDYDVSIAVISE